MDKLYIIIPAYNESENLQKLVADWVPVMKRHSANGASKLVIIDDGSKDNTYELLCEMAKNRPLLQPLTKPNGGHGATLLYGYRYALEHGADYVFQTDSDGQTDPAEFEKFWENRTSHPAIFGCRHSRGDGLARAAVEKILCFLLWLFFGVSLPDSNAPFRLMQANFLEKYLPLMPKEYNLPNVMLTTFGRYFHEDILFLPISFGSRQGGSNSINFLKIFLIGKQALVDFWNIRKRLPKTEHRKTALQRILILGYIFLLTFVFMMQSPLNLWTINGNTALDSSVFKTVALYIEKGYMPYKDIFDHKGPLLYLINYAGLKISYWRGLWILELFSLFVTFCLFYKLARLVCNKKWSCGILLLASAPLYSCFAGGNLTEEYAMPFIAVAVLIFAEYFLKEKISKLRLLICGFSFGAVCLLRINMAIVWLVFCIAVLIKCLITKQFKELIGFILWFSIGLALIVVPVMIWLTMNGAFESFIQDYILFNGKYINDESRASFQKKANAFISFVNDTFVLLMILASAWLTLRKKDAFHTAYFVFVLLSLVSISISGQQYEHYAMILVPAMVYPFAGVVSLCVSNDEKHSGIVVAAGLYLMATLALPPWFTGVNRLVDLYAARNNPPAENSINNIVAYIIDNTQENDRILVWGSKDIFYAKSKRLSASRYSYTSPIFHIDETLLEEYYNEINGNMPKLIIARDKDYTEHFWEFMDDHSYIPVYETGGEWVVYAVE